MERLATVDIPYPRGGPTRRRARIAAVLGDRQEAVALLRRAYREGARYGLSFLFDPEYDSLRDYEPFLEFMRPKG